MMLSSVLPFETQEKEGKIFNMDFSKVDGTANENYPDLDFRRT